MGGKARLLDRQGIAHMGGEFIARFARGPLAEIGQPMTNAASASCKPANCTPLTMASRMKAATGTSSMAFGVIRRRTWMLSGGDGDLRTRPLR